MRGKGWSVPSPSNPASWWLLCFGTSAEPHLLPEGLHSRHAVLGRQRLLLPVLLQGQLAFHWLVAQPGGLLTLCTGRKLAEQGRLEGAKQACLWRSLERRALLQETFKEPGMRDARMPHREATSAKEPEGLSAHRQARLGRLLAALAAALAAALGLPLHLHAGRASLPASSSSEEPRLLVLLLCARSACRKRRSLACCLGCLCRAALLLSGCSSVAQRQGQQAGLCLSRLLLPLPPPPVPICPRLPAAQAKARP